MSLLNGSLIPVSDLGAQISDSQVSAGNAPSFIVTDSNLPAPAQIYCAVVRVTVPPIAGLNAESSYDVGRHRPYAGHALPHARGEW